MTWGGKNASVSFSWVIISEFRRKIRAISNKSCKRSKCTLDLLYLFYLM